MGRFNGAMLRAFRWSQHRNRRASFFRHRARELVDQAKKVRDECDRRHMIEQAAMFMRAADDLAPPASIPADAVAEVIAVNRSPGSA